MARRSGFMRSRGKRAASALAVVFALSLASAAPAMGATLPPSTSPASPSAAPSASPFAAPASAQESPASSSPAAPAPTSTTPATSAPPAAPQPRAVEPRGLGTPRKIGPDPAFSTVAHGAITMASNSVVSCGTVPTSCGETANNSTYGYWVKSDPAAPGNTASSANLTIPPGATVLSARLYWQVNPISSNADSGDASRANQVAFKAPGSATYQRLTADTYDWFDALGSGSPQITAHAGVKDVTGLVKQAGGGSYTVADLQACRGNSANSASNLGCWGGWSLVVAYELDTDPLRYLQIWDGFDVVRGGASPTSTTIDLNGIRSPGDHAPSATMGVVVGDGDANISGDYLEFGRDAASLQRLTLPAPGGTSTNNAFSSRIDRVAANGAGSNVADRTPNPANNFGYDARTVDVTGKLPAGSDRAQLKVGTTGDALYPQTVWLMTEANEPNLQIVKSNDPEGNVQERPPGWVGQGGEISYGLDVANRNPDGSTTNLDTATGVVVTDTLPAGVSYVAGSDPRCTASGQVVTCQLPDLAPGQSTHLGFRVTVSPTVAPGTRLDNTASVAFQGKQTGREQTRTSNTVRNVVAAPEYTLAKVVDKATALPGDQLTYTVTLANTGPIAVPPTTVTDTLPPGTTFVSADTTSGTVTGTGPLQWHAAAIPPGGQATLTVHVRIDDATIGATLINRAKVTEGPPPTVPPERQCKDDATASCAETVVPGTKIEIAKTADKASANPGDTVTYTVVVRNTGQVAARGATFTDDLSKVLDDAVYNNDAAPAAQTSYTAPKLTWTGDLPVGGSATITYSVTVKNPVTGDHKLVNTVTSTTPGSNCAAGSTDPRCGTTTPVSGIRISKTADPASAKPGDTVKYTVTVANTGQTPLSGATFTDDLSKVLDDASYAGDAAASSGSVSYAAPRLTWTGDLPVGGTATVTYSVKVNNPDTGDHKLVNAVTSTTPGNNCVAGSADPACSTTTPVSGMRIEKKADKQSANPGDQVTYTVVVANTGQTPLPGATFTDDLSKVLDDASYAGDASASVGSVSYAAPKLTWTGDLAVGASATITYSVTVKNPVAGDHKLINTITSTTPGNNCAAGSADPACSTTTPVSGIEFAKTVDKTSANPGDKVTYTVTVRNTGETPLAGATFTDDLSQVLDDADYNNDAAPAAQTSYTAPRLTWTGDLPVGGSATVTYSVIVKNPVTGDHKLTNTITSATPGSNCAAGSADPRCGTTTPVSGMRIAKSADRDQVVPGDKVTYTITVTNTGQTPLPGATFTDDLSQVLDDADYNNDATPAAQVSYTAPKLTWTGDLPIGGSATVKYSVTVKNPDPGDKKLHNVVTSSTPGTNCPPGSTDPSCSTTTPGKELTVAKTVDKQTANPGDKVTYTVKVTNTGQVPMPDASFTDDLSQVLDDASYNDDASSSVGSAAYTAPRLTWTGNLPVGASATVTYSVTVKNPVTGDHQLRNTVSTPVPGNCEPGSTDPKCSTLTPLPGMTIEKKVDKQSANPGDKVTYTVTVTNTGKTPLPGATFTDDLSKVLDDAAYNGDAASSAGSVSYAAPRLTWTGDLPIGGSATVTYSVTVNNPVKGDFKLANVVTSDTPGGNCPPGSTDPRCGTETPVSGIAISKVADKPSANPGDKVTYTVTVTNTGQTPLSGATFTDDLSKVLDDAAYDGDAAASVGVVTYAAPRLTWTGDLPVGASATVTYSVTVVKPVKGDHRLTNVVTSGTPGSNCLPGSTDPRCGTTTPVSGLDISKIVDKKEAKPGDKVTYTVTVKNTGQTPLPGATFTDDLSKVLDDATYGNDAAASVGSVSYAAPRLTWTGDLPVGGSATVTYSVTVNNPVKGDFKLANVVTSDTPGGNCPPGSTDPRCGTTTPVAGLDLTKVADKKDVKAGDKVTYTVTVKNTGQTPLPGATFTDDLSKVLDDATYGNDAAASIGSVSYAAPRLTWTGDLPVGATATVTYSVTVNNPVKGDHRLANVVTSDTPGTNCPPESKDPRCGTTTSVAGLILEKKASVTEAKAGDQVTYTVTARNTGQTDLKDATFTDDLTGVLTNATYNNDATASTGSTTYAAPRLTWTGDLPLGAIATVTYSVKVKSPVGDGQSLRNVITSTTPGTNCPDPSTDERCKTTTPLTKTPPTPPTPPTVPPTPPVQPPPPNPPLASTGVVLIPVGIVALALLAGGGALLLVSRRRSSRR
ncbi:hypothetical protein [Amycolatopsis sp. La24]|uniref:COG1361 S-layer family protein n=1 Tax=Amycolatopsis sp. La24 TaxID=3028304 RepID=UPI0023B04960|nr:hypothetical protein [Amycolatopsis sp. La24]